MGKFYASEETNPFGAPVQSSWPPKNPPPFNNALVPFRLGECGRYNHIPNSAPGCPNESVGLNMAAADVRLQQICRNKNLIGCFNQVIRIPSRQRGCYSKIACGTYDPRRQMPVPVPNPPARCYGGYDRGPNSLLYQSGQIPLCSNGKYVSENNPPQFKPPQKLPGFPPQRLPPSIINPIPPKRFQRF